MGGRGTGRKEEKERESNGVGEVGVKVFRKLSCSHVASRSLGGEREYERVMTCMVTGQWRKS